MKDIKSHVFLCNQRRLNPTALDLNKSFIEFDGIGHRCGLGLWLKGLFKNDVFLVGDTDKT